MRTQLVRLLDADRQCVGIANVVEEKGTYSGTVDLSPMPVEMRGVFEKFESLVNGQVFSLLDEIEQAIDDLHLCASFDNGNELSLDQLQVYPREGRIRFRTIGLVATRASAG